VARTYVDWSCLGNGVLYVEYVCFKIWVNNMYYLIHKDPMTGVTIKIENESLDKAVEEMRQTKKELYFNTAEVTPTISIYDKPEAKPDPKPEEIRSEVIEKEDPEEFPYSYPFFY
jgi:hypothetical protein